MTITRRREASVEVAELAMPGGNALSYANMAELGAALSEAEASDARALVITGRGRVFSTGLDLVSAATFDREELGRYVDTFEAFFLRVFRFEKPLIAAINGHAIAGGCILAQAADYRVMASGPCGIGVTEVALGLAFPAAAMAITDAAIPASSRRSVFLEARRFSPDEALGVGLIDAVTPPERLCQEAVEVATRLGSQPLGAYSATKRDLREGVEARVAATSARLRERFVDTWFGAEAQGHIQRIREQLLKKRG